ncbi:MAG: ABC transporter permease subunit [Chloroflexi bacterium]|nr:ABC transporter permease subunit [Chloroflexota bacterium]
MPNQKILIISRKERFKIWLISSWTRSRDSWRIYKRNKLAVLGLLVLVIYLLMAVAHPMMMRTVWPKGIYDPVVGYDVNIFPHPSPPGPGHPLGTDTLGRDVLSILMAATRPSLQMALTAALTAAIIGTLIGAVSAYYRGLVDDLFSNLADLSLLAPAPIVMVVIGFMLDISPLKFGLLYGFLVGIGGVATVLRAHALTIMNKNFIAAARIAGGGALHIIGRHLIPHMLPLASVNMLLTVTGAIFANGFIAFLGLSRAQLNWGSMIYDAETYRQINGAIPWNVMVTSALAISLFAASFYLIALGLHDVAEPRSISRVVSVKQVPARKRSAIQVSDESRPELRTPLPTVRILREEIWQIAVLAIALHREAASTGDGRLAALGPIADVVERLESNGGLVERLDDGSLLASFGLGAHASPQACALTAVRTGLDLKILVECFNDQLAGQGLKTFKIGMGISTGEVALQEAKPSNWITPVLTSQAGHVARKLGSFAIYMREGGMLICETTYRHLGAMKHHFIFGRQGMAKLPVVDGQRMVYELLSS